MKLLRYIAQGPFQGMEDTLRTRAPRFHSCGWRLPLGDSSFADKGKMGCLALETSQSGNPLLESVSHDPVTQGWVVHTKFPSGSASRESLYGAGFSAMSAVNQ